MASDGADTQDLSDATHEPRECMACRGTGRVISNLGGSPSTVECPWCGGGGLRPAEVDAQAHWGEQGADAASGGEESSEQAAEQPGTPSG
jgi:DnaJ-class molecular chaperone